MKKLSNLNFRLLLIFLLSVLELNAFAGNTKLHIATDKEHYAAAEKIHFQVFLLNPDKKLNNSVFVELLDCNGKKISKQMLPFNLNTSSGNIELPEKANARFYILYCYVINNNSVESSISKKIWIQGNQADNMSKPGNKLSIYLSFEGGTFIAESPNNLLIRCVDGNDNPVIAKGKITDGKSGVYAVFNTDKLGYAKTILNPEDKVQYQAEIQDNNNNHEIIPIPLATSTGITLNAGITQSNINYTVISYTLAGTQLPDYRIEASQNGQTVYDASISFANGLSVVKEELKIESLPAGFICFRVLDRSNKVYAQRVIYNPGKPNAASMLTIIDTITKKEATIMLPEIISGKAYINIKTGSSIADTKDESFFIENAGQEDMPVNDQLIAAADLPNNYITTDETTNRYLSIQGTLLDLEKKPVKNKPVTLVIVHKNLKKDFLTGKTDKDGKIQFDNLIFYDSITVYYQLADKSEDKNNVSLDIQVTPASNNFEHIVPPVHFICANELPVADSTEIKQDAKTLQQVVLKTDRKEMTESEKFADKYVSGQMKRNNALRNEIDFIKNPEAQDNRSLWTYLQTSISGIQVGVSGRGNPTILGTSGCVVGVYLNDMELIGGESLSFLSTLMIKDVSLVKFYSMSFKPKLIGGNPLLDIRACDGGDLLIYTKRDYVASEEKLKGLPKTTIVGYNVERPDFASMFIPGNNESLFWKADWTVESGQRIYIGLPQNNAANNIDILIEGINSNAAPYRFTQKLVFK